MSQVSFDSWAFSLPKYALTIAMLAAIFFGIVKAFAWLDNISSKAARDQISRWLQNMEIPGDIVPITDNIHIAFEKFFGERHFSLRCLFSISLWSLITVIIALVGICAYDPELWHLYIGLFTNGFWDRVVPLFLIINLFGDYFSLLWTRALLLWSTKLSISIVLVASLIFLDLLAKVSLGTATLIISTGLAAYGPSEFGWSRISGALNMAFSGSALQMLYWHLTYYHPSTEAAFLYGALLTSIWIWLYLTSLLVVRYSTKITGLMLFLQWFLDLDQHPIKSVGIVAAIIASMLYLAGGAFFGALAYVHDTLGLWYWD